MFNVIPLAIGLAGFSLVGILARLALRVLIERLDVPLVVDTAEVEIHFCGRIVDALATIALWEVAHGSPSNIGMTAFVDGNGNVVVVCFVVFRRSCEDKLYLIVSRLEDVFNALWHSSVSHVWVVFEIPFGSGIDNECLCNFARQVHDLHQIGHLPGYPRSRERCARTPRLAGWSTDMHSFVVVTSNTTNVRLLEELEDWASA